MDGVNGIHVLLAVLIVCCLYTANCLRCQSCRNAGSLNECSSIILCNGKTEECYMEEIIDINTYRITYDAGCRDQQGCQSSFGRRRRQTDNELISCGRCCKDEDLCNRKLCGISSVENYTTCYTCNDVEGQPLGIYEKCNAVKTCERNEMCWAGMTIQQKTIKHYKGCWPKPRCVATTNITLAVKLRQEQSTTPATGSAPAKRAPESICDICCNDQLCNGKHCGEVKAIMYEWYKNGTLDLETLKYKPKATSSAPTIG